MTFAQPFLDYELLDRVGAGAMGTVFKARHKRLNRIVALKVLKPSLARDARYVDRLRREARIVASLNHPYIVTGYDLGEEGGYHFFVMEFVEGKSLRQLLVEWGMFAEEYVQRVARQTAQALDHAYQRGVIHRDIKPGNILIDESGNVKLTDMGLAKGPTDLTLTRDGATVGTRQYISPEQARNPHDVDVRTDLYSLGATLYHMATGVPPFRGDTMAELITNVLHETPVPPDELNPALSEGMALVIRKLLAKDLTVRYQTPRELLDDLERIERALPPQIDESRLSADAGDGARWWLRSLIGAGVLVLLGAAWWLGVQSRQNPRPEPTASEFLVALDADLGRLPTPGSRLVHLRTVLSTPMPVGSAPEVLQRERTVQNELQRAVDNVVDSIIVGPGWDELVAWSRDPAVWPDRARIERERLQPRLVADTGMELGQLRAAVRLQRLDDLLVAIDRSLAAREAQLVARFELFLSITLPARADERVRAGDFAGADRLWGDALATFCDGVRMPLPERVAEPVRRQLLEKRVAAHLAAEKALTETEQAVAQDLRDEVEDVCTNLSEQLDAGTAPEVVHTALQGFRRDLGEVWPASARFRVGRDPWPDLERQFGVLQQAITIATLRQDGERFERRLDVVWRAFCAGRAGDALQLLPDSAPEALRSARGTDPARHRAALLAARAVEQAVLQAIARQPTTIAFLRGAGAEPVELRAEGENGALRLTGNSPDQPARAVRLSELRFGDLLHRLSAERDPLQTVPAAGRALGVAIARMVGDDFDGIGAVVAALPADDQAFLVDDVWPRIQRVRDERPDVPLDRASLFARLRETRKEAEQQRPGALNKLENALIACRARLPEAERSGAEEKELREVHQWVQLARRQRDIESDLAKVAPRGADASVQIVGDEIEAQVVLPAEVLQRDAAGGWQLHDGLLEFAGRRPWSELALQVLEGNPGLEPRALHTTLTIQCVLPPASVGRRFWVFEFRGIGCMLVLGANDTVHAALVEGDVRRDGHEVERAFQRAIDGVVSAGKVVALPGAEHRLTIHVAATRGGARAMVRVSFEGTELVAALHKYDAQRPPTFAVHPQQEIAVRRVVVRASRW